MGYKQDANVDCIGKRTFLKSIMDFRNSSIVLLMFLLFFFF